MERKQAGGTHCETLLFFFHHFALLFSSIGSGQAIISASTMSFDATVDNNRMQIGRNGMVFSTFLPDSNFFFAK